VNECKPLGPGPDSTCNKCGNTGHWARECPNGESGGGGGGGRGPGPDSTCNKCGKTGHWARECPDGGGGGGRGGGRKGPDATMDASGLDNDLDSYFSTKPAGGGDAGDAAAEEMAA